MNAKIYHKFEKSYEIGWIHWFAENSVVDWNNFALSKKKEDIFNTVILYL